MWAIGLSAGAGGRLQRATQGAQRSMRARMHACAPPGGRVVWPPESGGRRGAAQRAGLTSTAATAAQAAPLTTFDRNSRMGPCRWGAASGASACTRARSRSSRASKSSAAAAAARGAARAGAGRAAARGAGAGPPGRATARVGSARARLGFRSGVAAPRVGGGARAAAPALCAVAIIACCVLLGLVEQSTECDCALAAEAIFGRAGVEAVARSRCQLPRTRTFCHARD